MNLESVKVWAEGLDHPEGVTVDQAGQVYAGGEAGQIYAVSQGNVREVANTGGFVLGMACDSEGSIFACDIGRSQVLKIDPRNGAVSVYSSGPPGSPLRSPNFPVFDSFGNLYVTDSGAWDADDGHTLRIEPGGRTTVWETALCKFPNGCALAPGASGLYIIESTRPGVSFVPILEDGNAGEPSMVVEFPSDVVPDGVAVTIEGELVVACYRPDRLYMVTVEGEAKILAEDPLGVLLAAPTNVVFAGDALSTLVISSLGRWHIAAANLGLTGLPLRYPKLHHVGYPFGGGDKDSRSTN